MIASQDRLNKKEDLFKAVNKEIIRKKNSAILKTFLDGDR